MNEETPIPSTESRPKEVARLLPNSNNGTILEPKWKQWLSFVCLFIITSIWIIFTIVLSFLSSESNRPTTIFTTAATTILILNILSTGSIFLLGELVTGAFEILRWTLAAGGQGVGIATFLAVSRTTGSLGTLRLLFSNQQVGHRKWGAQRIIHLLIRLALGVILLSNISLDISFIPVADIDDVIAGMLKFNRSIAIAEDIPLTLPATFMFNLNLLYDPKSAISIPPVSKDCALHKVNIENRKSGVLEIPQEDRYDATIYVIENVPGYQLEFFPIKREVEFKEVDCQILGRYPSAFLISMCMKNVDGDLMAGWSACPEELASGQRCSFDTSWLYNLSLTMQLHVNSRKATTAYSLHNSSILSVKPSASEPVPFLYSAPEVLDVLGYALNSNSQRNENFTLVLDVSQSFLTQIASIILHNSFNGTTSNVEYDLFRTLLTLPMYYVNAGMITDHSVPEDQRIPLEHHIKGYLAKDHFQLRISKYTLYAYTALALMILLWCAVICGYCWFKGAATPNMSLYPEINFAAKCRDDEFGMGCMLKGLGNSNSKEVEKQIAKMHVFVGEHPSGNEVVLTTKRIGYSLEAGKKYL